MMPLPGSLLGFPPTPTDTPSSVDCLATLEAHSQAQWPARDTHTEAPGSLGYYVGKELYLPRGPPGSVPASRTMQTSPLCPLTFACSSKSLTHEGSSWKPRVKKSIREPQGFLGRALMGGWGAQVDGVQHLSWASSLGVCTGVNLKVSTALGQTGNISRRGPELTAQQPDPGV